MKNCGNCEWSCIANKENRFIIYCFMQGMEVTTKINICEEYKRKEVITC